MPQLRMSRADQSDKELTGLSSREECGVPKEPHLSELFASREKSSRNDKTGSVCQ